MKNNKESCHSREGGNSWLEMTMEQWIPAFARMTNWLVSTAPNMTFKL